MKLLVFIVQAAIFIAVAGWIKQNGPENTGYAPAAIAVGVAYALTVGPLRIIDWLRTKQAQKRLRRNGPGSTRGSVADSGSREVARQ